MHKQILLAAATTALMGLSAQANHHEEKEKSAKHSSTKMGECHGINSCKGESACKTAKSACKGHNSCEGTGWVKTSEAECAKKEGTFKSST